MMTRGAKKDGNPNPKRRVGWGQARMRGVVEMVGEVVDDASRCMEIGDVSCEVTNETER